MVNPDILGGETATTTTTLLKLALAFHYCSGPNKSAPKLRYLGYIKNIFSKTVAKVAYRFFIKLFQAQKLLH